MQLVFQDIALILKPIVDTDEIEFLMSPNQMLIENLPSSSKELKNPIWCKDFTGKKLQTVWVCENSQGYRDQIIFAFDHLHPSFSFVAEGSVIKVFSLEQIQKEKISQSNLEKAEFNS